MRALRNPVHRRRSIFRPPVRPFGGAADRTVIVPFHSYRAPNEFSIAIDANRPVVNCRTIVPRSTLRVHVLRLMRSCHVRVRNDACGDDYKNSSVVVQYYEYNDNSTGDNEMKICV